MQRRPDAPKGEDTERPDAPPVPGGPTDATPPQEMTVAELEEQADRRGVTAIEGTGKDGNVVKADLVDAITDVPEPPMGRPPLIDVAQASVAVPVDVPDVTTPEEG